MERKRIAGYVTKQINRDFGIDVKVQDRIPISSTNRGEGLYPSGEPVPEGQTGLGDPPATKGFTKKYREVIPPGTIGSEEGEDLDKLGPPQYIDTVEYQPGEQNNPALHGAVASLRGANPKAPEIQFQSYATFEPRSAPMPRAAQDEGFLEKYPNQKADPLMTDYDSGTILGPRDANRIDLNNGNRDGVTKA